MTFCYNISVSWYVGWRKEGSFNNNDVIQSIQFQQWICNLQFQKISKIEDSDLIHSFLLQFKWDKISNVWTRHETKN